ncbi:MAG: hypothetical protein DMG57_24515 [Acidobacteria bacterium]|nr:MAG: hypothetical protein DMG57_24515 [Acidobacteriota bacterium]
MACLAGNLAGEGCRSASGPLLSQRIHTFEAREEFRLPALIRLGRENGLCFGIEEADNFNQRITLSLADIDARSAISAILGSTQDYDISVLHNVILIRDKRLRPPKYLSVRLPRFSIPRSTLVSAELNLWMTVEMYLDPSSKGFAGDRPPGDPTDQVGPFDLREQMVRGLLCRIVENSKGTTWISNPIESPVAPAFINGLWTFVLYRMQND